MLLHAGVILQYWRCTPCFFQNVFVTQSPFCCLGPWYVVYNHFVKNGFLTTLVNVDSALFRYLWCCLNRNNKIRQRHNSLKWLLAQPRSKGKALGIRLPRPHILPRGQLVSGHVMDVTLQWEDPRGRRRPSFGVSNCVIFVSQLFLADWFIF